MRKVEQQLAALILAKETGLAGNTSCVVHPNRMDIHLHGHCIARITDSDLELDMCGWNTRTTRRYMDRIVKTIFPNTQAGIAREKGQTYLVTQSGNKVKLSKDGVVSLNRRPLHD